MIAGLMVSTLVNGWCGQRGSRPGRGDCVVFVGRYLTVTVPLFTPVYKWVPSNFMLGVSLRWSRTPSSGNRNTSVASCYGNGVSLGVMDQLARRQNLPTLPSELLMIVALIDKEWLLLTDENFKCWKLF